MHSMFNENSYVTFIDCYSSKH